jgi:hypothetical protein
VSLNLEKTEIKNEKKTPKNVAGWLSLDPYPDPHRGKLQDLDPHPDLTRSTVFSLSTYTVCNTVQILCK